MRVAVLSSGGKDSAAAWWWAMCRGWEVTTLVTMLVNGENSMMFQIPGTNIVEHQAKISDANWLPVYTDGVEESEVKDLEIALADLEIDALVSGAIRSDYQKSRIERMCQRLGIISFAPLWHQSGLSHITGLVENGFGVIMTSVSCDGLTDKWLGRLIDSTNFDELIELSKKYRFNVDGEGGEYETLVVYGPHMDGKIMIEGSKKWHGTRGYFEIENFSTSLNSLSC